MIHLHQDLSHPVLYGNEAVLVGRNGRMFYLGRNMVRQSAGLVLRDQKVADAADMVAAMRDELARRGTRLLVAVPPNSSTIYQDDLPIWAQNRGRKTEYDLFLADLAARRVKAVDLRPVMKAVRSEGLAYLLHDTHWTARAALSAFNAIVEADSHPDWRLDVAKSLGPPIERAGGDVARVIGVQDEVTESSEELALPSAGQIENFSAGANGRLCPDVRQAWSDDHGDRQFIHRGVFSADAFAECRTRHLAQSPSNAGSTGAGSTSSGRTRSGGCQRSAS